MVAFRPIMGPPHRPTSGACLGSPAIIAARGCAAKDPISFGGAICAASMVGTMLRAPDQIAAAQLGSIDGERTISTTWLSPDLWDEQPAAGFD
jgi:hypothetical protein